MSERPDREYTVTFSVKVQAQRQDDAIELAADKLMLDVEDLPEEPGTERNGITLSVEEGECVDCGGEGEIAVDEYENGNQMRGVGSQKCLCRVDDGPDRSDD